ncbi:dynamin family protein [Psychrobacter sp. 72-O-c]|uniref:dynamin family protein n=1 Tax=Psychrobacter sp. 72-O-c TaxID=2774125 RepID=UPI0019186C18|nr:dynamin family protein [Psychrobacter sp. 72-O-c]
MHQSNNLMTKEKLNAYKADAIKILETQISMLSDIESEVLSKENKLNTDEEGGNEGILTHETCEAFQEILKGEVHKLQNFDVVLAVVGTMKAGKSTTINAIVGREILPNRNRPMTSLPTLICHNKEQQTPKLTFNSTPINDFLVDIKNAISIYEIENPSPEIVDLINFIQADSLFSDSYNGETNIFNFLQLLNDLVRLTATLNTIADKEIFAFPYDSYKNIDALPTIEIAFKLKEDFETNGRFMLLDTAGPNESGHKELLSLLREQLKRSSAVMLVLDYTQLNSEAEESIKNEIETIPTIQKSRLFALVNKFDQESANADDANSTKHHIFNNLLKDKINFEHIYPISARDAYLANRMETYLLENKVKPEYKEGTWIEDFAKQVLGKRAEQKYSKMDMEDISEELDELIKDSLMTEPLTDIILNMQKNAPYIAIQSALTGASDVFDKLHNFFNIRGHFADKEKMTNEEINNLEKTILDLKNQIKELQSMSKSIKVDFLKVKTDAVKKMKKKEDKRKVSKSISDKLDEMFDIETNKTKKNVQDLDNSINSRTLSQLLTFEKSVIRKERLTELDKARELAKSNSNSLIFPDESKLNAFKSAVMNSTSELIHVITEEYRIILNESIEDTQNITKVLHHECNVLLNNLQEEFNKEGMKEIKIDGIDSNIKKNEMDLLDHFSVDVKHKRTVETRSESGTVGSAKRFFGGLFNKNWGTYKVDIETYTINKKDMSNKLKEILETKVVTPLKEEIAYILSQLLEKNIFSIDEFNDTIKSAVVEMNNAIVQEKMPDLQTKKYYKKKIKSLQQSSHETEEDWERLSGKFSVEKIETTINSNADIS